MSTVQSLDELVELLRQRPELYIRWSKGPEADADRTSRDSLTGAELPGLCANPLAVEDWWEHRPVQAWVLEGAEVGRGPDNEPLVDCHRPVAWVADEVVGEAKQVVDAAPAEEWGPLRRA